MVWFAVIFHNILYPLAYKLGSMIKSVPHLWSIVNFKSDFTQGKSMFAYKRIPNFSKMSLEKLACLYAIDYSIFSGHRGYSSMARLHSVPRPPYLTCNTKDVCHMLEVVFYTKP